MKRQPGQIDDAKVAELAHLSNSAIARELGCNEASVRRARKRLGIRATAPTAGVSEPAAPLGKVEYSSGSGEGTFTDVRSATKLTDWTHVFEQFGLDPDEFTIVDDTVTMKAWQQSKRLDDGDRDTVTLYSYGARFRRKTELDRLDLPALYASVRDIEPATPKSENGRTTVVAYSDPQTGKVASRGNTKDMLRRSFLKRAKLTRLLEERQPEHTVLLDGGDGIEGFESGGNPMFTNDLSLAGQLDVYGTELMEWIKTLHAHAPVTIAAVPSNHAAWRQGKQNLGRPADDLGLFMHQQVRKVANAAGLNARWVFPAEYDESVAVDVHGTKIGLVHGNQFGPGQAITWWEKQTFGAQAVATCDVLVTAHYHSFGAGVAGRNPATGRQRMWLGAPTLDNGSDWFRNTAGRDSDPGVLVFDITEDGFDLESLTII